MCFNEDFLVMESESNYGNCQESESNYGNYQESQSNYRNCQESESNYGNCQESESNYWNYQESESNYGNCQESESNYWNYQESESNYGAATTAPWPSRGLHHCGKFLEPSDEWAGRGSYCFLMRWHSWAFLAGQGWCRETCRTQIWIFEFDK